jgi:hypothetical protein
VAKLREAENLQAQGVSILSTTLENWTVTTLEK